ncbi:hypothetical protein J2X97_003453 [Epilithonimonas hungarica]|nr:hypothetical protein [Epilithonimonas hungarica]
MISTFIVHKEPFTAHSGLAVKTKGIQGFRKFANTRLASKYFNQSLEK